MIAYTLVGLIIVLVAGLETAFRFEQRAVALRLLATEATANLLIDLNHYLWEKREKEIEAKQLNMFK